MIEYSIGNLAKKVNVNVQTIRYYERRELIPPPKRRESGYRIYTEDDVAKINFIKKSQSLGFSLKEIKELLNLKIENKETCGQVRLKAESKISEIEIKLSELRKIQAALKKLIKSCELNQVTGDCPIIEFVES